MVEGVITYTGSNGHGTPVLREGASEGVSEESIMGIGSIGKMFIAAVTLQLAEEGKFSLDDRVADVFSGDSPEHQAVRSLLSGNAAEATVADILAHKGGVANITPAYVEATEADMSRQWKIDDAVPYAGQQPEAGTTAYSNFGYMILGQLIEEVESRPYESVVKERIIEPLGLESTGYIHQVEEKDGLVRTGLNNQDAAQITAAGAAGSMFASARDLDRFITAFSTGINGGEDAQRNPLFNTETLNRLRDSIDTGTEAFGIGFIGKKDDTGQVVRLGHGGQTTGYLAYVRHDLTTAQSDVTLVAADNVSALDMGARFGKDTIEHHHAALDEARALEKEKQEQGQPFNPLLPEGVTAVEGKFSGMVRDSGQGRGIIER